MREETRMMIKKRCFRKSSLVQSWGQNNLWQSFAQQEDDHTNCSCKDIRTQRIFIIGRSYTPCGLPSSRNVGATHLQQNSQRVWSTKKNLVLSGAQTLYFIWQSASLHLHRLLLLMGSQYERLAWKQGNRETLSSRNMALPRAVSVPGTFEPEHHHSTKHTTYTYYTPSWKIDRLSKPTHVCVPTDDWCTKHFNISFSNTR